MKINTYRAKGLISYSVMVNVGGVARQVSFGTGSYSPRLNAYLRTSDKVLQMALERHPEFNKTFVLENTEYIKEAAPKKEEEVVITKPLEFNNFNELRDFLIKEKGKAPITVSTMAKAEKEMIKLGIRYTMK